MIKIDVFIKNKNWKKYIPNPKKYLNKKSKELIKAIPKFKKNKITFTILLGGNQEIKKLNKKFRKKNKTTDVLSFPFYRKEEAKKKIENIKDLYLGDIILNYYKITKNNKKEFTKQFNKLWIHGFLHLLGHKHYTNKDFYKMRRLENKLLKKIND
tara:strand:- start:12428 stop:12892 length:465 start_codon:yes stop_codon:yes gene_type:complete